VFGMVITNKFLNDFKLLNNATVLVFWGKRAQQLTSSQSFRDLGVGKTLFALFNRDASGLRGLDDEEDEDEDEATFEEVDDVAIDSFFSKDILLMIASSASASASALRFDDISTKRNPRHGEASLKLAVGGQGNSDNSCHQNTTW
jgi:hypothetical protein